MCWKGTEVQEVDGDNDRQAILFNHRFFLMAFIGTPSPRINSSSDAEIEDSMSNELSREDRTILKQFGERAEHYFREFEIWVDVRWPGIGI